MKWLVFLAILSFCAAAQAQLDRSKGGGVSAGSFSGRYVLQSASPANLRWVSDPAGSSRTVLQAWLKDSEAKVYGGKRTEIVPSYEYVREGVRWYAMSFYFPASWQFHAYPTIVGQIHTSQKTAVLSPPLAFMAQGDHLDLELYANHLQPDVATGIPATRTNSARQLIRLDTIKKEQWYCFVIRADWSYRPGLGSLKVWMNGDRVYEGNNLYNAYETWLGNYPKAGLYSPGMMGVSERMLYLDFIHLGGERSGFDEMAAQTPCGGSAQ